MDEIKFSLKPVNDKPLERPKKSKYDPIIDAFLKSAEDIAEVHIETKNLYSVNYQIKNRIKFRDFENKIESCVIDNSIYLEILNSLKHAKDELKDTLINNIDVNEEEAKEIIGIIYGSSSNYFLK